MSAITRFPNLFSPVKISNIWVKNRIGMMPMAVFTPRLMDTDGSYTKDGADYYIARAKGGTGLIITGLLPVIPIMAEGPNPTKNLESYSEHQKYLADGVHSFGSKVFVQLSALTGRSGMTGHEPAPSEIQNVWNPSLKNPEISIEKIKEIIHNFAEISYAAKQAGIDGVEIHAVHEGYILDQFAIANMNYRRDEYGGSLENRLRITTEIIQNIKKRCGKDFPVSLRYSVKSYIKSFNNGALPGEKFVEFGRDIDESKKVVKIFEKAGLDLLNCDNGSYDSWYWPHPPSYMPKACNLSDVSLIKKEVKIPIVCAGRFDDPILAESAIKNEQIDIMGLGRPLLADAEIGNKFYTGKLDDVRPCICCHNGCFSRIFMFKDLSCAVNPSCGKEVSYSISPANIKKKILVVGGGISGMEAARVCTLRGHNVEIFEKSNELGGVFIAASIPDYKEDEKRLLQWYKKQVKDLAIKVKLNTEVTNEMITTENYDEIFIATGAIEPK